jgi:hypothetical protein
MAISQDPSRPAYQAVSSRVYYRIVLKKLSKCLKAVHCLMFLCSTNMISLSLGVSKLHCDSQFDYFKVVVEPGVRMVEGATVTACTKEGMEAACKGPRGCTYNDESK